MVINSLSFCWFGKVSIPPSFLKDSFTRYRILGWQLFSFNILNMSSHSLLVWKVSVEISANNLMEIPLYIISLFSLTALKSLSLSLTYENLIIIYLSVALFGFNLFGIFWDSLIWRAWWIWVHFSFQLSEVFSHYRFILCPFLDFP